MEDQLDRSCFVPGISISFQTKYQYYTNLISPFTMLSSIWSVVCNAAVIFVLARSGIRSLSPGLLMMCSLTLSNLLWGLTLGPMNAGFRMKHFTDNQVCEVYSELANLPREVLLFTYFLSTFGNFAVITVDRFFAVRYTLQYKLIMCRRRAIVACSLVWLISLTVAVSREIISVPQALVHVLALVFVLVSTSIIIIGQILTLWYLHRHNNMVSTLMQGNGQNPVETANVATERELTKTTVYVIGVLAIMFIPGAICIAVAVLAVKKPIYYLVVPILPTLVTLYTGIDPIFYFRGNRKVREGILSILKYIRCK
ncbi:cannabinoid receptor 1-like [Acropora muricata]|uniref:melanocortin receptor 4-like n=1 Tax=Acropora millepora TaxID=45264 RepID=UPI001CF38221|nr:melanocortin receptor 4-like [Acropora millepora]